MRRSEGLVNTYDRKHTKNLIVLRPKDEGLHKIRMLTQINDQNADMKLNMINWAYITYFR